MKRAVPMPTAETQPFWGAARQHELRLPRCCRCGKLHYPPPPRCPQCLDSELRWELLSGEARLLSWTRVHLDTVAGVAPPFTIAEAELIEQPGLVVVAHIVPGEELSTGMCLDVAFADADEMIAFPEFRVAGPRQNGVAAQADAPAGRHSA
jgi:uncharacterized protein